MLARMYVVVKQIHMNPILHKLISTCEHNNNQTMLNPCHFDFAFCKSTDSRQSIVAASWFSTETLLMKDGLVA